MTNAVFGKADGAAVLAERAPPLTGGGGKGKVVRIRLNRALTYEGRNVGTTIVTGSGKSGRDRSAIAIAGVYLLSSASGGGALDLKED